MSREKRYKYNYRDELGRGDSQWSFLKQIDGKIVKITKHVGDYALISQINYEYPIFKVLLKDLDDIDDEPVSDEELSKRYTSVIMGLTDAHQRSGVREAVEELVDQVSRNQELRHMETMSFEECFAELHGEDLCPQVKTFSGYLWEQFKKSHNLK